MRGTLVAGVAAAVLASTPALADLKMKTGLWKTSVKIEAAGGGMSFPTTEVHISNPARRGGVSEVARVSRSVVMGFGIFGYSLAMRGVLDSLQSS